MFCRFYFLVEIDVAKLLPMPPPALQPIETKGLAQRLQSIDILRGAIMVLMAIDHVRVYSGQPAGGSTVGIFFTRWVTHFCAPGFVFLAGTSAFLYGIKLDNKASLARFLITRGLLLVFLELTVIRFFWMFNFNYANFTLAGVIWMLGWCMVLLAAFVRLKPAAVGVIGLAIIAFQQVFHYVPGILPQPMQQTAGWLWGFFYPSGLDGMPHIAVLFVIIPWIGVMMAGYGFGNVLLMEAAKRKRYCLWVGLSATAVFLVVGIIITFLQSAPDDTRPFIFRLLAQQKYPPSQLFLIMTLGPLIALAPFAEKAKGWLADILILFGRVPMFYYLLHILLIHLSALFVNYIRVGDIHQDWYITAPFTEIDEADRWPLPLLYLVYAIDLVILFFCCRWYANYKANHREKKWLKYL